MDEERKGSQSAPYAPRAQFLGTLKLMCPYCGNVGLHRIALGQWRIECRNDECRRDYVLRLQIAVPVPVRSAAANRVPDDYTFPRCELNSWRPGDPAHSLVTGD